MKTVMHELVEELKILRGFGIKISDEYIAGLLEKEKEQIIDAYWQGAEDIVNTDMTLGEQAEDYYNEFYINK